MGNTRRNSLTKRYAGITALGCEFRLVKTLNQQTGCIDEDVTLSHPKPISEVAFDCLDREGARRRVGQVL